MRVYLEIDKVGIIGDAGGCFVVGDRKVKTKTGYVAAQPAYYTNFIQALRELHERFLVSKIAGKKACKSLEEFIKQIQAFEVEWVKDIESRNIKLIYPANRTGE